MRRAMQKIMLNETMSYGDGDDGDDGGDDGYGDDNLIRSHWHKV